ncbi:clathrin coat assembly protein ap17 [Stylonychia lemnae]|uniref:Clathrin coat assembly protein ap17 n=1 Tax=Stylonychia lemnae TaxID=5949 RepID=A0A078AIW5_STYLE|nr:clathrin coat assembly protein ap17 [Stylonychia lemnae]|eukprot:CDW82164.1 clathrin coat assembly protein ap17 [Stylonychia lemnae]
MVCSIQRGGEEKDRDRIAQINSGQRFKAYQFSRDQYFGSVCELDLVFNFFKVYQILDSMVIGGEVMETAKPVIRQELDYADYYE